jgi:hypothetical protein
MTDTSLVYTIIGRIQSLIQRMSSAGEIDRVPSLEGIVKSLVGAESALADAIGKLRKAVNGASRTIADIDHGRQDAEPGDETIALQLTATLEDLQLHARTLVPANFVVGGTIPDPTTSGSGSGSGTGN